MPDVLIRDVEESLLDRLKAMAASEGRSLQSELHEILDQAAGRMTRQEFVEWSDKMRAELSRSGRKFDDSTLLIREDRDR
jgi:plasmid stability protein